MTPFERDVAAVLLALGPGDLVTYGEVAMEAGHPGAARAVGSMLRDSASGDYPWWRVVTNTGRLVPGAATEQAELLTAEGFEITGDRVQPRA
jgi:methylated-DNA-protein-cysteine methyltransferase-like protein